MVRDRVLTLSPSSAIKDTILPLKTPIIGRDGQEVHEALVPVGTTVFGSILIPNTSTQIWGEDASEFKPERWLSPLPDTSELEFAWRLFPHVSILRNLVPEVS